MAPATNPIARGAFLIGGALLICAAAPSTTVTERERFAAENAFRERQQSAAERELAWKQASLAEQRRQDQAAVWRGPLFLAVIAAIIAAGGNAVVARLNGIAQRKLERERADASRDLEREKALSQLSLERDKAEAQVALEREKAAAQRALDAQQAESNRILEVIKTGDPDVAAGNMQFLVDAGLIAQPELVQRLSAYLKHRKPGAGPALPLPEGRFRFQRSTLLDAQKEAEIGDNLARFIGWLEAIGFPSDTAEIAIEVNPQTANNAYYDPERHAMVLGTLLRDDPDVARREYMHHVLTAGHSYDPESFTITAIESALADYFAASFADSPVIGTIAAKALNLGRGWVRTLATDRSFGDIDAADANFDGAQVWGSMFWTLRGMLGTGVADRLLRTTWQTVVWPKRHSRQAAVFTAALVAGVSDDSGKRAVVNVLRSRDFPTPRTWAIKPEADPAAG